MLGIRSMPALLLILLLALGLWWLVRSRQMFRLRLRHGELEVRRGHVPGGVLSSFRDALRSLPDATSATITGARTANGVRLTFSGGIPEGLQQRLRNILSLYPISQFTAPAVDAGRLARDGLTLYWLARIFRR